jgi:hypothetical protein
LRAVQSMSSFHFKFEVSVTVGLDTTQVTSTISSLSTATKVLIVHCYYQSIALFWITWKWGIKLDVGRIHAEDSSFSILIATIDSKNCLCCSSIIEVNVKVCAKSSRCHLKIYFIND